MTPLHRDVWQKNYPSYCGWWWMKKPGAGNCIIHDGQVFPNPMIAYVSAHIDWGPSGSELRLPEEAKWRELLEFEGFLWAGPIMEPLDKRIETPKPPPVKEPPVKEKKKPRKKSNKRINGKELVAFKKKNGFMCAVCGWTAPPELSTLIEVHHIVPVSKGGSNKRSNLILLCPNHHRVAHQATYKADKVWSRDELIEKIRELDGR